MNGYKLQEVLDPFFDILHLRCIWWVFFVAKVMNVKQKMALIKYKIDEAGFLKKI